MIYPPLPLPPGLDTDSVFHYAVSQGTPGIVHLDRTELDTSRVGPRWIAPVIAYAGGKIYKNF